MDSPVCRVLLWILLVDILFRFLSNRVPALCRVWKRPSFPEKRWPRPWGHCPSGLGQFWVLFLRGHLLLESFPSLLFVTLSIWIFCLRRSFIHLNFQIWKFKITQEIEKLKQIIMTKETQLLEKGGESAYKKETRSMQVCFFFSWQVLPNHQ